jgi:hypothetical protein
MSAAEVRADEGRGRSTSAFDPGCVKTCASRECAGLFSLFSSFEGDCQRCSFPIQRNRDKVSTRKSDVEVFTQAGPIPEVGPGMMRPVVSNLTHPSVPISDIHRRDGSDASQVELSALWV